MIRLVADQNITGLESLPRDVFEVTAVAGRELTAERLRGADALWVRSVTRVNQALLEGNTLRFVGTATAGLDHIDIPLLSAREISFAAAPGANANAVVEYVLTALAELREPWERLDQGEPLAIVGYGHVGRGLAVVASSLGWNVSLYDPWVAREEQIGQGASGAGAEPGPGSGEDRGPGPRWVSLEEALQASVISLHCSLHTHRPWPSHHLVGRAALAGLSKSQWLVNASRGAVVDNAALLERLASGNAPQLVLDVWEQEPAFDDRLLDFPELHLATPHIAGYSWDAKWRATQMLLRAMLAAGLLDERGLAAGVDPGQGAAPPLAAVAGEGVDAARSLLRQRYCIADDDRALRDLAGRTHEERATGFDGLRRDYPQRRELRGSRLREVGEVGEATPLMRALGVG